MNTFRYTDKDMADLFERRPDLTCMDEENLKNTLSSWSSYINYYIGLAKDLRKDYKALKKYINIKFHTEE